MPELAPVMMTTLSLSDSVMRIFLVKAGDPMGSPYIIRELAKAGEPRLAPTTLVNSRRAGDKICRRCSDLCEQATSDAVDLRQNDQIRVS